jgi:hypothetical protein
MTGVAEAPAIFDPRAVSSLTGDAHDREFAVVFVTRFRRLLPERVHRISASLADPESGDAMEAVLSLKVASCTLGAGELCEIGRRIESHLRRQDVAAAAAAAAELPAAATRAHHALTAYLQS